MCTDDDDAESGAVVRIEQVELPAVDWSDSAPAQTARRSLPEAIRAAVGSDNDRDWVEAVIAASERQLRHGSGTNGLRVFRGTGDWFHVTSALNRESIRHHGLDWALMTRPGIAGSHTPEVEGIFLTRSLPQVQRLTSFPVQDVVDVWVVRLEGEWLETGPDGAGNRGDMVCPNPIAADRLTLRPND